MIAINLNKKFTFFFPIASALNTYSITILLIFSGLVGHSELTADIAIVQAAIVAIFLSLSANARNIMLSNNCINDEKNLLFFRLAIMLPAALTVFFLTKSSPNIDTYLVIGLIFRKCSEWIIELQLAKKEREGFSFFAVKYTLIDCFALLTILLIIAFKLEKQIFFYAIFLWAFIPSFFSLKFVKNSLNLKNFKFSLKKFLPHVGSTTIIGFSMFFFRVLVIIFAGKVLAGQMFTAYAIGGAICSIFTTAIYPSIVFQRKNINTLLLYISLSMIFVGIAVYILSNFIHETIYSNIFIVSLGLSISGGGLMLIAQSKRLYLIQSLKKDVFVVDSIVNIILVIMIPFVYYLFEFNGFTTLFLISGVLNVLFYVPLYYKTIKKN